MHNSNYKTSLQHLYTIRALDINILLTEFGKSNTSINLHKKKFHEIQRKYHNHIFIYTNGSKRKDNTNAALIIVNKKKQQLLYLPKEISFYPAENFSLLHASLYYITHEQNKNLIFAICTNPPSFF